MIGQAGSTVEPMLAVVGLRDRWAD